MISSNIIIMVILSYITKSARVLVLFQVAGGGRQLNEMGESKTPQNLM
jgi:hypothetical protein